MKDNDVIGGHLSPCVRIFLESLLEAELATSGRNAGDTEVSIERKKGSKQAERPEDKARGRKDGDKRFSNPAPVQRRPDKHSDSHL